MLKLTKISNNVGEYLLEEVPPITGKKVYFGFITAIYTEPEIDTYTKMANFMGKFGQKFAYRIKTESSRPPAITKEVENINRLDKNGILVFYAKDTSELDMLICEYLSSRYGDLIIPYHDEPPTIEQLEEADYPIAFTSFHDGLGWLINTSEYSLEKLQKFVDEVENIADNSEQDDN